MRRKKKPLRKRRLGRAFLYLIGDIFITSLPPCTHIAITMNRDRNIPGSSTGGLSSSRVKFSLLEKATGPIVLIKFPAGPFVDTARWNKS